MLILPMYLNDYMILVQKFELLDKYKDIICSHGRIYLITLCADLVKYDYNF